MMGKARVLAVVAAMAGWWGGRAGAQPLPASPTPVALANPITVVPPPPSPALLPGPPPPPPPSGSWGSGGPPPACAPFEDRNGYLLQRDPFLDPPCAPQPGWFAALELDFVGPHIKNRLANTVTVAGIDALIHLPTAELEWTTAPRLELGYRFDQAFGEVLLSYRSLVSEGRATLISFDPADEGFLKSRLNLNVIDLDYASREFSLGPQFDMKWRIGVRLADLFFDSRAADQVVEERTSNSFFGVGPHAGLDLWWHACELPEFSLFTRLEGAVLLGRIQQSFEGTVALDDIDLLGGATTVHKTQAVPVLHLQVGVGYTPRWTANRLRFVLGYDFEQWWSVGKADGSNAELTGQGVFFRSEFNY